MDRCETERDGHRCNGDAAREHDCEAQAPEYAYQPTVEQQLAALRADVGTLQAQVRSLQCALPSGIGHAGLAKVGR